MQCFCCSTLANDSAISVANWSCSIKFWGRCLERSGLSLPRSLPLPNCSGSLVEFLVCSYYPQFLSSAHFPLSLIRTNINEVSLQITVFTGVIFCDLEQQLDPQRTLFPLPANTSQARDAWEAKAFSRKKVLWHFPPVSLDFYTISNCLLFTAQRRCCLKKRSTGVPRCQHTALPQARTHFRAARSQHCRICPSILPSHHEDSRK